MGGWTLQDVHNLAAEDYRVLVEWINETNAPEGDGIDMDAVVAAKLAGDAHDAD
jgi:hypothetical protein